MSAPDVTPLVCSALDRAFARMLVRRVAPLKVAARPAPESTIALGAEARRQQPLLYHTGLLVSAARAEGHGCIDLARYAGQVVQEDASLPPFALPTVARWQDELRVSGACAIAGEAVDPLERATLVLDGTLLYLARFHDAERRLASRLRERLAARDARPVPEALFARLFADAADDGQRDAALAALQSPLVFITGGPGTGKTTIAARVLALLLERDPTLRIALAAPTGRAAARLSESMTAAVTRDALPDAIAARLPRTGVTLHRLLGYRPWDDRFGHHAAQPLAEDVVVVDEASMVDLLMMDALFAALKPDARLIVLGDADQLASVETGFVLGDVVDAAAHPSAPAALRASVARLTTSYRFRAHPAIGALAAAARAGDADAMLAVLHDEAHPAVRRVATDDRRSLTAVLESVRAPLERYLATVEPAAALDALAGFRVLCALRDGDAGVVGLNAAIERWLRRRGLDPHGWYPHRPVLITQNDPATQLFNGDVGTTLLHDGQPMVFFPGANGPRGITPSRLPAHETAWAMTVHKAQGSEFDHVVMVLPETDSRVLTRELVYTGITRAKQSVALAASDMAVRTALSRRVERSSGLGMRLRLP